MILFMRYRLHRGRLSQGNNWPLVFWHLFVCHFLIRPQTMTYFIVNIVNLRFSHSIEKGHFTGHNLFKPLGLTQVRNGVLTTVHCLFAKLTTIKFPRGGGRGVLPYKGLMGTCGQPGYAFRDFCLKQGIDFIIFCLNQGIGLSIFVLNRISFLGR